MVSGAAAALRLLHDTDAAVQLALGVVVVDVGIGIAEARVGHRCQCGAARVVGAAMLEQDIRALLAARSPSVGQRRLATGIPAFHVHPVLWKRYKIREDVRFFQISYIETNENVKKILC